MNIIQVRQQKRREQINVIIKSIKKSKKKKQDFKEIVLLVMSNLNLSRRTAREYVEVAFFELGINNEI